MYLIKKSEYMYIMKLTKTFKELCTPAALYFVISAIAIIIALFNGMKLMAVGIKAIFVIIYTFFLNFLCQKGFKSVSWFLVLLPYILMLAVFLMAFFKIKEGAENMGASTAVASAVAVETISEACKQNPDGEGCKKPAPPANTSSMMPPSPPPM
jgi:DNA integrity scanning protein DisA with diadenylate cyclase activity